MTPAFEMMRWADDGGQNGDVMPRTMSRRDRHNAYMREWNRRHRERCAAKGKEWREKNREHKSTTDRAWRDKNRERCRANNREYYKKTIDHHKVKAREWREKNRDYIAAKGKEWREKNRDRLLAYYKQRYASYDPTLVNLKARLWYKKNPDARRKANEKYMRNQRILAQAMMQWLNEQDMSISDLLGSE